MWKSRTHTCTCGNAAALDNLLLVSQRLNIGSLRKSHTHTAQTETCTPITIVKEGHSRLNCHLGHLNTIQEFLLFPYRSLNHFTSTPLHFHINTARKQQSMVPGVFLSPKRGNLNAAPGSWLLASTWSNLSC